jgi:hypothetical protein
LGAPTPYASVGPSNNISSLTRNNINTFMIPLVPQQVDVIDKMFPIGTVVKTIKNGKLVDHEINSEATTEEKDAMKNWMTRPFFGENWYNILPFMTSPDSVAGMRKYEYSRDIHDKEINLSKSLMDKYGMFPSPIEGNIFDDKKVMKLNGQSFRKVYRPKTEFEMEKYYKKEIGKFESDINTAIYNINKIPPSNKDGGTK